MILNFFTPPATQADLNCPICGDISSTRIAEVSSSNGRSTQEGETAANGVRKCNNCETLYWERREIVGYLLRDKHLDQLATTHYCLVGAGIDLGVEVLSRLSSAGLSGSLLEVGCGFGFSVNYWNGYLGRESLGLEMAPYGHAGATALNIPVEHIYLEASTPPIGQYDIVYSSEVIEHVQDPRAFVVALKNNLKQNGVIALTTPFSGAVSKDEDQLTALAALSPGFHEFVLSPKSFRSILEDAGFKYIKVEVIRERMIAFASNDPNVLSQIPSSFDRLHYINYLEYLSESKDPLVREGALYRYFKELVNKGEFSKATEPFTSLVSLISNKYSLHLDLLIPGSIESKTLKFSDTVDEIPPYLGSFMYYSGLLFSRHPEDIQRKLLYFSLAVQVLEATVNPDPMFAQEAKSLLDTSRLHYRTSLIDCLKNEYHIGMGQASASDQTFASPEAIDRFQKHYIK